MSRINQHIAEAREAELARRALERTRTIGDRPMQRRLRFHHLLVTVVVAAAAAWPLTPLAHAGPTEPTVPTRIQVPDGNKAFLVGHAAGVQIYACNVSAERCAWGLVAPRAMLYDNNGKAIATHFGGPTWQATDGSTVVGRRVDGVTVDPTAIPWLLLSAASTSARSCFSSGMQKRSSATASLPLGMNGRSHDLSRKLFRSRKRCGSPGRAYSS
jgi:hypothetical protein